MKKLLILPLVSLSLFSCSNNSSTETISTIETPSLDGKKLMEKNCFSCHNTQGTDKMLAPPMHRVKDHYWDEGISKQEFVSAIVEWCKNPTEENSVMPGARRKFGLMPKQIFDEMEVEAIANFLYESEMKSGC